MEIEIKKNNFHRRDASGRLWLHTSLELLRHDICRPQEAIRPARSGNRAEAAPQQYREWRRPSCPMRSWIRKMLARSSDEIQYNLSEIVVDNVEQATQLTNAPLNNRFNPFDITLNKSGAPTAKLNIPVTEQVRIQFYELKKIIL
jgi:hypothetical protein